MRAGADCKNYYAELGVPPSASMAEIRDAYKRLARERHPDRNPSPQATEEFQRLTEAFATLSDPTSRAEYDALGAIPGGGRNEPQNTIEKISCSVCKATVADLRVQVYFRALSLVLFSTRQVVSGVYCSTCAARVALSASLFTVLLGWWAIPWGPIYSIQALFVNAMGGKSPPEANARLLTYQAAAFAMSGQYAEASHTAHTALRFARAIPKPVGGALKRNLAGDTGEEAERAGLISRAEQLVEALKVEGVPARETHGHNWGCFTGASFVAAVPMLLVFGFLVCGSCGGSDQSGEHPRSARQQGSAVEQRWLRPSTDPNGRAWPRSASLVAGYPELNADGYSVVDIDNVKGTSDMFVKLCTRNGAAVRVAYVPRGERFRMSQLNPGTYEVRFLDLDRGIAQRTDEFDLTETNRGDSVEYSEQSFTLYKVVGGNADTREVPIDAVYK